MYAIISDTHLGLPSADTRVFEVADHYRNSGYTVVWLGDVFDLWVDPDATRYAADVFRPGDIYIMGNHDYGYRPPEGVRFCPQGLLLEAGEQRWFALHGDILDFPYLVALLKQGFSPLSKLKRWSGGEYQHLYRVLAAMPPHILSDLLAGRLRLEALAWLVPMLWALWRPAPEVPTYRPLSPGPLLLQDAATIAERVAAFCPEAWDAHGIVLGHLHKPMQGQAGKTKVQVLGAWCDHWPRTVGVLDESGLRVELWDAAIAPPPAPDSV